MLKLELDWASDSTPDVRADEVGFEDERIVVEYDDKPGPSGWPTVRVYARTLEFDESYRAAMSLNGWLIDVYGEDEDGADELANLAEVV